MTDQWVFKSETYDNCNCAVNCGCQFNLPSTYGYCQSAFVGNIIEGHFNDTPLAGLNWAGLYKWPGEIAEETASARSFSTSEPMRLNGPHLKTIISGEGCAPLSSFSPSSRPHARNSVRHSSCRLISRRTSNSGPQGSTYRAS